MSRVLNSIVLTGIVIAVGGFLLIKLVPYGCNHTNPQVINELNWDSPQTKELAQRACYDCHNN